MTEPRADDILDSIRDKAKAVAELRKQFQTVSKYLKWDLEAAAKAGKDFEKIVEAAAPGMPRHRVSEILGEYDLYSAAEAALKRAGFGPSDYQLEAGPPVRLYLDSDAAQPKNPVEHHRDYEEGDPYWEDLQDQEGRAVKIDLLNLIGGMRSVLRSAGIGTPEGTKDALLAWEGVDIWKMEDQ